jgi:hypothetical protein
MDIERTPVFIGRNFRLSEWIPHNPLDKRETRWDKATLPSSASACFRVPGGNSGNVSGAGQDASETREPTSVVHGTIGGFTSLDP